MTEQQKEAILYLARMVAMQDAREANYSKQNLEDGAFMRHVEGIVNQIKELLK